MASSLIRSSHHIDFDSFFGIDDAGLVQMFESLTATGLKNFLGCPTVFYEAAHIEFFENSLVRDGMVVSTIKGKDVEISEEVFAATLFSISKEQVSISCLKKEMKIEYRLLSDILAKTIYVKAGSFDVVTPMETVAVAQEAVPLQIFEATADAPVEQSPVPKRKIQKRKRRLVIETDDEINVEKQPAIENLDEQVGGPAADKVVPVVEASTDDPDVIIQKVLNQLDSVATTDGEDQPAETAEERQWFDLPYEDIMAQLDAERPVVTASDTDEEMEQVDVFTEINTAGRIVGTDADAETMDFGTGVSDQQVQTFVEDPADEEMSGDGEKAVDERIDADEAMSLEDIILSIPVDVPLPSAGVEITKITMGKEIKIPGVDERTWNLASLPQIKVDDKGKEPLKQKDPIKGHTRDCGAVIARNNTSTPSKCWIRTMIRVDGVWAVEPCANHWVKIPRPVVLNEVPRQCSYVDTLPTVSEFFKIMTKRWADVCLEVVEFCVSGKLLPVGSINLCRSLPVAQPVFSVAPRQPTVLALRIYQFCIVFLDYSLFSRLPTVDITSFVASIASERTVLRSVQILSSSAVSPHIPSVASTDFVAQRIPLVLDQHSFSSSSSDASMHFDDHDTATTLRHPGSSPRPAEQPGMPEQQVGKQNKPAPERHGVKPQYEDLDEQVAATRNDLLEFSAQAQQTLNVITDQLSELVAYINRGGNNKKGEVVSSSRPQPPPDDQNRDSGIAGGGGDTNRSIVERLFSADRQRQRERSRGHSSGYCKRRRY
ncbi:vacuolar proton ATPase family protein [Dorcoceras hygrometricum]|uniref:Vacuolar proton ATPase family protein n=1 Tax=Dorcoceras hygrometricum TaxID=472368 RepID=A0A2Z7BKR9_9LAMI|nr:vacuolar proton ATPase family protein [Dorcoceras hygrometricum]